MFDATWWADDQESEDIEGNIDTSSFPSKQSLYDENRMLMNYEPEYIIGTCMIENLTDGFPITPDKPRTYAMSLTAEGNGDVATFFNDRSVSVAICSDRMIYYGDILSVVIGDAKMASDTWGPCTFVIALPNVHTPNQPDGYRYDEIQRKLALFTRRFEPNGITVISVAPPSKNISPVDGGYFCIHYDYFVFYTEYFPAIA